MEVELSCYLLPSLSKWMTDTILKNVTLLNEIHIEEGEVIYISPYFEYLYTVVYYSSFKQVRKYDLTTNSYSVLLYCSHPNKSLFYSTKHEHLIGFFDGNDYLLGWDCDYGIFVNLITGECTSGYINNLKNEWQNKRGHIEDSRQKNEHQAIQYKDILHVFIFDDKEEKTEYIINKSIIKHYFVKQTDRYFSSFYLQTNFIIRKLSHNASHKYQVYQNLPLK